MLIGIDASRAVSAVPTGTETYSWHLIRALLALDSRYRFRLYFRTAPPRGEFAQADLRVIPFPRLWTHVRLSWEMARRPPEVLFVPAHVLPPIHPPLSLATVHDLGYLYFPQAHPVLQRLYLDLSTRWNARAAAHLLADSEATKADLIARYNTPPEKVTVAYPGYAQSLAPVGEPGTISAIKARYGIEGDYFLHLGTLQPRKNLSRLVAAFGDLQRVTARPSIILVLAGRRGWLYDDLLAQVRDLGLEDRVLFTGYVPAEHKAALLSGALALVLPSLYEGFGLPVLEAQACGCPVICANTSSLPEVAGEGALLVDPTDTAAWAQAMARIASNPSLRALLVAQGFANLGRFSWEACARTVLRVVERLLTEGSSPAPPPPPPRRPHSSSLRPGGDQHEADRAPVRPPLSILGVPVHNVSYAQVLDCIARWIAQGGPHQIATVNPEFVMAARRNAAFRGVLEQADLCLPDGVGITLAARYLRRPLQGRVAGVDLVEALAARAAQEGWRLFLLGAGPGVAERAARHLLARHPGLVVCGTHAGSPAPEEEADIVERVRATRPHVLLVAYGAPAQDLWLARNLASTGAAVGLGVGGAFDYLAGTVRRAPAWMRRLGLEWAYRLLRQPWRWRRQLALPGFALLVLLRRR